MRRHLWIIGLLGLCFGMAAQASSTLRVGSQVLTAGDSSERVLALLGKPSSKAHQRSSRNRGRHRRGGQVADGQGGEQWRYRRGDHVTVVTLVDGKVSNIEDGRL